MITGYNLPHLAQFSAQQLQLLVNVLPKGLTYRLYGGEESQYYTLDQKMVDFISDVEGRVILVDNQVMVDTHFTNVKGYQLDNESYLFNPPTIFNDFWGWVAYTFRKNQYYRQLAQLELNTLIQVQAHEMGQIIVNLPLRVNQNGAFKAYAETWLQSDYYFDIDLHLYGGTPEQLRGNLEWYKNNTNRDIHFLEFYGLPNDRYTATIMKNTQWHADNSRALLDVIDDVLGSQVGEILHFTLAGNEKTRQWRNSPYLHRYQVESVAVDQLNTVYAN